MGRRMKARRFWSCAECGAVHPRDDTFTICVSETHVMQFCSYDCVQALHVRSGLLRDNAGSKVTVHNRRDGALAEVSPHLLVRELQRVSLFVRHASVDQFKTVGYSCWRRHA